MLILPLEKQTISLQSVQKVKSKSYSDSNSSIPGNRPKPIIFDRETLQFPTYGFQVSFSRRKLQKRRETGLLMSLSIRIEKK